MAIFWSQTKINRYFIENLHKMRPEKKIKIGISFEDNEIFATVIAPLTLETVFGHRKQNYTGL